MFCSKCGELLPEGTRKCPVCGARISKRTTSINGSKVHDTESRYTRPQYQEPRYTAGDGYDHTHYECRDENCTQVNYTCQHAPSSDPVGFPEAVRLFFTRFADFHGRSRRSEYWWAILFVCLVSIAIEYGLRIVPTLWTYIVLVPSTALGIRRLHDVGKSGKWYLFVLLPIAGPIILLTQMVKDSAPGNQWGPNPKY